MSKIYKSPTTFDRNPPASPPTSGQWCERKASPNCCTVKSLHQSGRELSSVQRRLGIFINLAGIKLQFCQAGIDAAFFNQRFMGADFSDGTFIHHHDAVGFLNGCQAVGDNDGGAPHHQFIERLLDKFFALRIKGAGRLIKQQYRRVF